MFPAVLSETPPRHVSVKRRRSGQLWVSGVVAAAYARRPQTLHVQGPVASVGEIHVQASGPAPGSPAHPCVSDTVASGPVS